MGAPPLGTGIVVGFSLLLGPVYNMRGGVHRGLATLPLGMFS